MEQGPLAHRQEVYDRELHRWEEKLQLRHPIDADEAGTDAEDLRFLSLELMQLRVLLENMPSPALCETLVNVAPGAHLARLLVYRGEPQGLSVGMETFRFASRTDHAVVGRHCVQPVEENGLDCGRLLSIEALHFTPDEFHAHCAGFS